MKPTALFPIAAALLACLVYPASAAERESTHGKTVRPRSFDEEITRSAIVLLKEGRRAFRNDTFGDEAFWGGQLQLHRALATLTPEQVLDAGLKVNSGRLSPEVIRAIRNGTAKLDDPSTTIALLQAKAVVGVRGFFDASGNMTSVGITCALCHSTVDDAVATGIGRPRDGWPNRDLDVGLIVSLAPNLEPLASALDTDVATVKRVLTSWGPGKYDAELNVDGKAVRPDGKTAATLLPAAFGLAGVNLHTYTGWGSVTYWNAYVANTQMHGIGTFFDPRLDDPQRFPLAARNRLFDVRPDGEDRITPKLAALHFYQLAIPAPKPDPGTFDAAAADAGEQVFNGKARCASCHVPPLYTEPGWAMHTAEEIGIDDFQAQRSPDGRYRTTPLRGLFTRMKGGFYHDGRFADLDAVIAHYDAHFGLGLTADERRNLIEYLKSL